MTWRGAPGELDTCLICGRMFEASQCEVVNIALALPSVAHVDCFVEWAHEYQPEWLDVLAGQMVESMLAAAAMVLANGE